VTILGLPVQAKSPAPRHFRPIDYVSVKGKRQPVLIYELLGEQGAAEAGSNELAAAHGEALEHYRRQNWEEAIRLFERVLALRADDPPARRMIARCRAYQATPPGPEWDGVYRLDSK
jgi:adenylate cyclase